MALPCSFTDCFFIVQLVVQTNPQQIEVMDFGALPVRQFTEKKK